MIFNGELKANDGVLISAIDLIVKRENRILIEGFSLELKESKIVFLLGANGAGKSTLMQTLAGLHGDFSGVLKVSKLVWLPQSLDRPSDLSVGDFVCAHTENVRVFLREDPFGVVRLFGKSVEELSGGQWQRVLISVCLCSEASVYLLDEPSNNLDNEGIDSLIFLLQKMTFEGGSSFVIATHDQVIIERSESLMTNRVQKIKL